MNYLVQLFLILLLVTLSTHLANWLKMPGVIGALLIGVIVGPAILNFMQPTTFTHYFSEIGVIVLMFTAGLEGDLGLLLKYWKPSLVVATLGVIFPTGTAFLLCHSLFGYSVKASLFMGLVLSATSVSITVQVLKELNYLNTSAGAVILGAAVADDIICVILLGIATGIYTGAKESPFQMIVPKILFFVIVWVFGRWVVPWFLTRFKDLNSTESLTAGAMILCFGGAAMAVAMGMSDVLGSYFAGLAISQTPYAKPLASKVEPIGYAVFIPAFFISIGLDVKFAGMSHDLLFIVLLIITAILGKQIGCGLGARIFGLSLNQCNIVGAGMVSRGEMALVVANVALASHVINTNHYTAMVVVTVITTILAPFILKFFIVRNQKVDTEKSNND